VLLAYGLMYPNRTIYIYFLIPVRAKYLVLFFGVMAFLSSLSRTTDGVAHLTHLSGMVVGYLYLRSGWRISTWQMRRRGRPAERTLRTLERKRREYEQLRDEVDVILDKINEVGYDNLTEEERKLLYEASELIGREKRDQN